MVEGPLIWRKDFTFRGRNLFYNRVPFNNRAERAVEIPLAFDFLARQESCAQAVDKGKSKILEVGNVLQYYENALSDASGIRCRRIVDKFEVGYGIDNIDIINLDPEEQYSTIIAVSTMEHVGQNCTPTGEFGEQNKAIDLEGPLKAIAKIYDLLAIGGRALVTVPFGKLIDGGWYVQFSAEYLELLMTKYGIPQEALAVGFLKRLAIEPRWSNPRQLWVETEADELRHIKYDNIWSGARAIAVIELTKLAKAFSLNLAVPPTSLRYDRPRLAKSIVFTADLLLRSLSTMLARLSLFSRQE
jgi:hypothetical protein